MSNRRGLVPVLAVLILSTTFAAIVAATASAAAGQAASRSNARNAVTVIGCVRNPDESVVGTSGHTDPVVAGTAGLSSSSPNDTSIKFMLVNVTPGSTSEDIVGTSGTKSGSAPLGYRLDGDAQTLSPHVGHKVEIVATVANPGSTSAPENSSILINAPRLKVISVRTLASTCQ
jgi:hypothetical protein